MAAGTRQQYQAGQTTIPVVVHRFLTEGIVLPDNEHEFIRQLMEENEMQARNVQIDEATWLIEKGKPLGYHATLGIWFDTLLVRWVVHDNIAFHKIESRRFRDLIIYLNPSTESSLPTDKTLKAWLIQAFKLGKDDVLRQLQQSITMSFDLWSSRNMLALLGICVHFLDMDGRYQSFLLALPEQEGTHTGVNIAANIIE